MSENRNFVLRLGLQLSNHVALYALSAAATFVISLVNLGFLTHYLEVVEFGRLAVLLVFAALLTIVYNLVLLQGTFGLVFRGGGDEEGGFDVEDEIVDTGAVDKRRTLTTGLLLTLGVCATGTALIWAFAGQLSTVLGGVPDAWVRLAALSGASGAIWRFVLNVLRFERRPFAFAAMTTLRPVAVLALSIPLVVGGHGVPGVLVATTVGTTVATLLVLILSRANYAGGTQLSSLGAIGRRGGYLVPVILSFWVINNVDLYLLSLYSEPTDTAHYRVAARMAAGMSYFVSAFLMAWMPLSRTAVHKAIDEEHGVPKVGGTLLLYYWAAALWVIIGLALLADLMVRVSPASYGPAAPLIPIIACSFVAYGVLVVLHRMGSFRLAVYVTLSCVAAAAFTVAALLLIPRFGSYGASIAPLIGFSTAVAIELFISQRSAQPLEIPYRRLAMATALAALLWAFGHFAISSLGAKARLLPDLALVASFPFVLATLGVLRLPSVSDMRASGRRARDAELRDRLPGEDSVEWEVAELLLSRRMTSGEAAESMGITEGELLVAFSRTVEGIAGTELPEDARAEMARFLLLSAPTSIRDDFSARVLGNGVKPNALAEMEVASDALRRAVRSRRGRKATASVGGGDDRG